MSAPKTRTVSKVIVAQPDGRILLLKRSISDVRRPLEWDIPGGHTDDDEYSAEAAARETMEESGITLDPRKLRLAYAMTEKVADHMSVTWLFYIATTGEVDIKLSHEHVEYVWATLDETLERLTYERQQRVLTYIRDNDMLAGL